ncbi:MAG: CHAT domain-containing protein [Ignavibacteriae bacterium]|nr:CHAT domain-containing protein [Ignavibacteriota bacterium]
MRILFLVLSLFTIHCSLFIASAQSWKELIDSTNYYQENRNFETALSWGQKALYQAKKEFGEIDTNYASTLGTIADLFYNSGKLDSTIKYQEKNLKLSRILFKGDNPNLATAINDMAFFYEAIGNYIYTEQFYKEALDMCRRLFKEDHSDLATSINNMAYFYDGRGRYDEAESLYKEALDMCRRLYKGDHKELATSINNMAYFYDGMGRYDEAEPLYKEALDMCRHLFIEDNNDLATSINNMAYFYDSRGRYVEAEPLYKEALDMCRRLFKEDHPDLVTSINNIAYFYDCRGRYVEAELLYKEALDMCRRLYKGDHPDLALSIDNMAYFYKVIGSYAEAEPLCKEAFEMYRRLYKGDHPDLAISIKNLAKLYECIGQYKEAEPLYKEALEMNRRLFNGDNQSLALSIINIANFYCGRGLYEKAEPFYKEALEMHKRLFKKGHSFLAISQINFAYFYIGQFKYSEAEPLFIEGLQMYSNILFSYFPSLSEKEKGQFWSTMKDKFESFNSFLINREKDNPSIIQNAYNNLLMTKGLLISSTQKVKNNILNNGDKDLIRKFEEWQFERGKIAKYYTLTQIQLKEKNINLDSAIASANDKEKELSKLAEGFSDAYHNKQVIWEEVQNSLKQDEAAIEFVRFNYFDKSRFTDRVYYAALILKKNSNNPELVLLKNGNDLETKYIKNYKRSILNKLEDKDSYAQFWEPIAKKLNGIKRVYVSPDGVYNQINITTLMNPKTEHFLTDDLDIRVVSSTRDLVEGRGNPLNPPESKGENIVELFGDPLFNLDSTKHLVLANSIAENRTREFYYLSNTLDSTTRGGIMPLPSTRTEIEQIANEFVKKGWKVNTHLGEKALEEVVKRVDNPKVLHIATHGKFLKNLDVKNDERMLGMETKRVTENPLLRSFLLLSGAENTLNDQKLDNQNADDGLLTAYEAMNLNLDNTDLVVLSACETGLGEIKNGEGVYGLQRAFRQAGAKSIIMSLWSVPDKETQELMTNFYSIWLNGKDKRTAFNEARNEMRDKYHFPYYWGGFVIIGE